MRTSRMRAWPGLLLLGLRSSSCAALYCFVSSTISARLRSRSHCVVLLLLVSLHLCNHLIRVLWGSPSHLGIRSGHAAAEFGARPGDLPRAGAVPPARGIAGPIFLSLCCSSLGLWASSTTMLVKFGACTELHFFGVVGLFDDYAGAKFWAADFFLD